MAPVGLGARLGLAVGETGGDVSVGDSEGVPAGELGGLGVADVAAVGEGDGDEGVGLGERVRRRGRVTTGSGATVGTGGGGRTTR